MNERRRVSRQRSFLRGCIYFNNRNATAECLVRDISTYGARLILPDEVTIPDIIELYIAQKEQTFRAQILWRHNNEIGIAFENAEQADVHPSEPGDLAERVQKLEDEIHSLKKILKKLKTDATPESDSEAA
jgi:hypothetical protein